MKIFGRLVGVAALLFSLSAWAAVEESEKMPGGKIVSTKFFDKQMVFEDRLYALNDVVEFSVFDISTVEIVDNSGQAKVEITSAEGQAPNTEVAQFSGKDEIAAILPEIPKYFYTSLKAEILKHEVPITLYPKNPPGYSKPIKLAIKLKTIDLLPVEVDNQGNYVQPVRMKIYGQLKDKSTDSILTRFYDSEDSEFLLGTGNESLQKVLDQISHDLMADLAGYLRTKY